MREDLNPDSVMDGINALNLEIQKLEERRPIDLDGNEEEDINEMMTVNNELRDKVNEVSLLVKNTLSKIYV